MSSDCAGDDATESARPNRRELLAGTAAAAIGICAPAVAETVAPVHLAPDGRSIQLHRIYSGEDNKTLITQLNLKGVAVRRGETSIVPPGCIRLAEGPAMNIAIRNAVPGTTLEYHHDPAQQHQLTVAFDGSCVVETRSGAAVHIVPGEITSIEDTYGEGHRSTYPKDGFFRMFIGRPANA